MIQKTNDYSMFKFRDDNRKVIRSHVNNLKASIREKNFLPYEPIDVNGDFEVIDGQHRLTAAKELELEIYYVVREDLEPHDMITMNANNKNWKMDDFFRFYLHHKKPEYLKLQKFMIDQKMQLRVALGLLSGRTKEAFSSFKNGTFQCRNDLIEDRLRICWDTISIIRKHGGYTTYLESAKFWKSLVVLTKHPFFDEEKWKHNLMYKVESMGPRATFDDYLRLLQNIYNWKNSQKISLRGNQDDPDLS